MQTKAVRMYAKCDLRLDTFELPEIAEDEILAEVISDSICLSTWKAAQQGTDHKRVPSDIAEHPVMVGHEFCGRIVKVGKKWQGKYQEGMRFAIQPNLNYNGSMASPGYAYRYVGGAATYVILPQEVMLLDCLLPFEGDAYFLGSLAEPLSCIIGTFHAMYHTTNGVYEHRMGIKDGGSLALLASAGPMGLGAIDYALHCNPRPATVVVTDIDEARLTRARSLYPEEAAAKQGVQLLYLNGPTDEELLAATDGRGFDDVMVFAPVKPVIEQADRILGQDGCLNFFAGPANKELRAEINFYNVHYAATHLVGTSGGNTADMLEALDMMAKGLLTPAGMVTHVGGLDATVEATLNLPNIPGGKKLIYTHLSLPLTAVEEMPGHADPLLAELGKIVKAHDNTWSAEAEAYLLQHGKSI